MALTARNVGGGADFEVAPSGNHVAVCYSVIDLGEHEQEWQGKVNLKHRIRISWELCEELMTDGRPFSVSKEYTLSLNEKATLRHDLESWRGVPFTEAELAGFDVFAVLGAPCMVNVVHQPRKDGTGHYAKLAGVAKLPKGMPKPTRVNELMRFSLEEPDAAAKFATLPDWLKGRINLPAEGEPVDAGYDSDELNDQVPF